MGEIREATPSAEVPPRVVEHEDGLADVVGAARLASRLAVDLEASGMFAYRARPCTMQLGWDQARAIVVIDLLKVTVAPLRELLGPQGPVKIVHDVAFDARLLAEAGAELGNVHDTAVAARMLGRAATGLASLLQSELGLHIDKGMQHHDWRLRPLGPAMLGYLAADVAHLEALEATLWREVIEHGIEDEVLEETRYRLASAATAARQPISTPPYARIKGVERLPERERAILRDIASLREQEAQRRDVPPHRVASNDALMAIAHSRPTTAGDVARLRGMSTSSPDGRAFVAEVARAVASAPERLADDERARFERPVLPSALIKARREREGRLLAWRRAEAKLRSVDEQVVMPGHCVKDAVEADPASVDDLSRVAGIGAFRVLRDGEAILRALRGPAGEV